MRSHLTITGCAWLASGWLGAAYANSSAYPEPGGVEEVIVSAPEPRYVAPTLRDRIGRIWAPVYINGKGPFRLVLDTGANRSAVIHSVAQRLGLEPRGDAPVRLQGVTGSSVVPTIEVDRLQVGDLWLDDRQLPVLADVFGGAEGVLGTEGLGDKRISIDFKRDEISILRSRRQRPGPGYKRIPVELHKGRLLMFDMRLGGVRTKAMLDTGAQRTIGNNALRAALERRSRQTFDESVVGVTLDVAHGQAIDAPPVEFGGVVVRGMRITFGDLHIFNAWNMQSEPALLIGMDVIGVLESLVIDYRLRELHVRPRG